MLYSTVTLPTLSTSKDGLLSIRTTEEGFIHQSWEIKGGQIIVFESIPNNYPQNTLSVFPDIAEYIKSIKEVGWINDQDYVVNKSETIINCGYPFE